MAFFRGSPVVQNHVKKEKSEEYIEQLRDDTAKNKTAAIAARSEITQLNDEISRMNGEIILLNKQLTDSRLCVDEINIKIEDQERQFEQSAQKHITQTDKLKQDIVDAQSEFNAIIEKKAALELEFTALKAGNDKKATILAAEYKAQSGAFTDALSEHEKSLSAIFQKTEEAIKRQDSIEYEINESINSLNETNESIKLAELLLSSRRSELSLIEKRAESLKSTIDENNSLRETINSDKLENTRRAKELATWSHELKVEAELIKSRTAALIKREQTVKESMERLAK